MADLIQVDEDFIKKVDDILDGDTDKVPLKVQVGLILAMQTQMAKATNALVSYVKAQNGRVAKNESAIEELKKKNIVNWIVEHPKAINRIVLAGVVGFFILEILAHEALSFDVSIFVAILQKLLGL